MALERLKSFTDFASQVTRMSSITEETPADQGADAAKEDDTAKEVAKLKARIAEIDKQSL